MSDLQWSPDLHERLASRAAALTRLTRAAAAAAAAAVAGWLLGLSPGHHAVAVLAGAGVAAVWPLRHGLSAAFETIAQQAGLAYQTHVEHTGRSDPHGLLAAASVQARLSIRGVTPPRQGAWWLPLAALALAVWLLASVVGGPGGWFATTPSGSPELGPTAPSPPSPIVSEPESEPEAEAEEVEAAEPGAGPPPPAPPERGPGSSADDAVGDSDAEGLEREALERFLDSVRERPSFSEAELAAAEAERDGVRDDADADVASAELGPEEDESEGFGDGQPTPSDRPAEDATRDQTFELPGGDPADPDSDGLDEEQRPDDGADAGDGDDAPEAAGDEALGEEGTEPDDDAVPQPERNGDDTGAAGVASDEPGLDAGSGEDAGIGAGSPVEGDDQVPDAAGELEALPGLLGPGPETLGGRVRLPGRDSELTLEGGDAARFERAAEQAVTDGSVPVTYQEIIRNYFR